MGYANEAMIVQWIKQEKFFLYKLGYVFFANEEKVEKVILETVQLIKHHSVTSDRQFKDEFILLFIEQCLLKQPKKIDDRLEHSFLQQLFNLEVTTRSCVYMKYVLQRSEMTIAKLLKMEERAVVNHISIGLEQLIRERNNNFSEDISIQNLLSYHEGRLSFEQYKKVNEMLVNNLSYEVLLEQLLTIIDQLASFGQEIHPTTYFLEDNKPLTKEQMKKKQFIQRLFATLAAIMLFVVVFISSVGLDELWQKWKIWQGESVGYGEKVFVSAVDQDIEIIVTHVAADDMQTILFYEIRDLEDQFYYNIEFQMDKFEVVDQYERDKWEINNYSFFSASRAFSSTLNEDIFNKGRLFLPPLKKDEDIVTIRFHTIDQLSEKEHISYDTYYNNINQIHGEWIVTVPVKKYQPMIINIDETISVDNHEIIFQTLEVRPTGTFLGYEINSLNKSENYYNPQLYFSRIEAGEERSFDQDFYLSSMRHHPNLGKQPMFIYPFEAIYYDLPERLEVQLDRIISYEDYPLELEIDYENLPMELEFLDTTITIAEVEIKDPLVFTIHEEVDENRGYDNFQFDFIYDFHEHNDRRLSYGWGVSSEGIYIDREGNKYSDFEEIIQLEQPYNLRYLTTKQTIEIYFHEFNGEIDETMLPNKLLFRNFSKSHWLNESIVIDLKQK